MEYEGHIFWIEIIFQAECDIIHTANLFLAPPASCHPRTDHARASKFLKQW